MLRTGNDKYNLSLSFKTLQKSIPLFRKDLFLIHWLPSCDLAKFSQVFGHWEYSSDKTKNAKKKKKKTWLIKLVQLQDFTSKIDNV